MLPCLLLGFSQQPSLCSLAGLRNRSQVGSRKRNCCLPSSQLGTRAQSSCWATTSVAVFSDVCRNPDWNRTLSKAERGGINRAGKRDIVVALQNIRDEISKAENNWNNTALYQEAVHRIRQQLHIFEHEERLDEAVIRESRILYPDAGLPRLFKDRCDGFRFPFDVCADAKSLWKKWCRTDLDPNILVSLACLCPMHASFR